MEVMLAYDHSRNARIALDAVKRLFAHELPKVDAWLGVVARRDLTCAQAEADWF